MLARARTSSAGGSTGAVRARLLRRALSGAGGARAPGSADIADDVTVSRLALYALPPAQTAWPRHARPRRGTRPRELAASASAPSRPAWERGAAAAAMCLASGSCCVRASGSGRERNHGSIREGAVGRPCAVLVNQPDYGLGPVRGPVLCGWGLWRGHFGRASARVEAWDSCRIGASLHGRLIFCSEPSLTDARSARLREPRDPLRRALRVVDVRRSASVRRRGPGRDLMMTVNSVIGLCDGDGGRHRCVLMYAVSGSTPRAWTMLAAMCC